jgi:hypothetical protein
VTPILAAYFIPLLLSIAFWTVIGAEKWRRSGSWPPISARIAGALFQSLGPIAWTAVATNFFVATVAVAIVWATWLFIVFRTPLRKLSPGLHFVIAILWNFSGCLRVGLWV